jgi:uncharacterized protein YndB with AHSA1/START domain
MTSGATQSLHMTRLFAAEPERVFEAWLDPAIAETWLFTSPASERHGAQIDARVGGQWTITDRRAGQDYTASGVYLEIDRPRRLVFTFGMPQFSPESVRIILAVEPAASGCVLNLTHERLPHEHHAATETGWSQVFDALAANVERSPADGVLVEPGTIRFERVLAGPIDRVWAYLVESDKRGKWLATGHMQPRVGSVFELRFQHASLSSQVDPTPERFKSIENGHVSHHQLTRFEPPTLLSFTWDGAGEQASEVRFELTPQRDNVLLALTHRRLADRALAASVAAGWHAHLAMLVDRLDGREPPSFWSVFGTLDGEYQTRFGAPH